VSSTTHIWFGEESSIKRIRRYMVFRLLLSLA